MFGSADLREIRGGKIFLRWIWGFSNSFQQPSYKLQILKIALVSISPNHPIFYPRPLNNVKEAEMTSKSFSCSPNAFDTERERNWNSTEAKEFSVENVELEFNSFPVKYAIRKLNQLVRRGCDKESRGENWKRLVK